MLIDTLVPTHNEMRDIKTYKFFVEQLKNNDWTRSKKIAITQTEDKVNYLWDGCHIVCAAYSLGIREIPEDAYIIDYKSYNLIKSVNFSVGYVTPFDPKIECRLKNFMPFKSEAMERYGSYLYIFMNQHRYKEPRRVNSIKEIVDAIRLPN